MKSNFGYRFLLLTNIHRLMFLDFCSFSLVVEPQFGVQNIWADRFVRKSSVDFMLHRCFLMRSKERVFFSKEKQERDGVKKKEKGRKEKKVFF